MSGLEKDDQKQEIKLAEKNSSSAQELAPIRVTEKAKKEILRLYGKRMEEGKAAEGLRIGIRGGGCTGFSYVFEWSDAPARSYDHVLQINEVLSVFVDPKSLVYLQGTELDYVTKLMEHGFKFNNPNAKGSCGCGDSVQF